MKYLCRSGGALHTYLPSTSTLLVFGRYLIVLLSTKLPRATFLLVNRHISELLNCLEIPSTSQADSGRLGRGLIGWFLGDGGRKG